MYTHTVNLSFANAEWKLDYNAELSQVRADRDEALTQARRNALQIAARALALGDDKRPLALFAAGATGAFACLPSDLINPLCYYPFLGVGAAHLGWQVYSVDLNSRQDCLAKFKSNSTFGAILFAALVAGKLLADDADEEKDEEGTSRAGKRPKPSQPQPSTLSLIRERFGY